MAEPIVFISTHKIRDGKLDKFTEQYRNGATVIEEEKPGTVAFLAYLNDDETEVSTVHVFPDADAMERHMEGVGDRAKRAVEYLEFHKLEVWGSPSDDVLEMMQQAPESGVTLSVMPQFVSGYLRLRPE